jgi:D-3-phosphoglycerate dehydrogenase
MPSHSTIRILNVEPLDYCGEARAVLSHLGEVVEAPLGRTDLLAQLPSYDVLIVRLAHQVDRDVIDAGTRLRAIVTATTGLDHIDVDYAQSKGITVLSLRGETEFLATVSATAEHAWALLLTLVRRIPEAFADVKNGGWRRDAFRGQELCGKQLGIVGLGRIGRKVAGYGLSFGMKVIAYDPYTPQWLDAVEQAPTLEALLRQSEVLTLHIPLTQETTRMIGWEELCHLPEQAILINTSRGEIVDEDAICKALESGRLAGAALDVICNERDDLLRHNSVLLNYARHCPNLVITPHIGGATYESMKKTEVFMAQKLASFIKALPVG